MGKKIVFMEKQLSPLENDILELLWKQKHARVREIYDTLRKKKKKVAHTSVAVFLDRLYEKKLVKRDIETCRGGFRYMYTTATEKEDFHKAIVQRAVDSLIHRFGNTAISYFNERFSREKKVSK